MAKRSAAEWVIANPERAKETGRRWREANAAIIADKKRDYVRANAEAVAAQKAAWYAANAERVLAEWQAKQTAVTRAEAAQRARQWSLANPERRRRQGRVWYEANPDKVSAAHQRRRARLQGVPFDNVSVGDLLIDQAFACGLCELPIDTTLRFPHPQSPSIDHVVPLARGGTGLRENLQATHLVCNLRKSTHLVAAA